MRKKIEPKQYQFLKEELQHWTNEQLITKEQMDDVVALYDVKEKISFIRILLTVGSVLIGLGILSFIASNWAYMGKISKYVLILTLYTGVNYASFRIADLYPKTSRSLTYLGILIFGAGIFLVGQIFHYGGHFTQAFLLWTIGTLPMALLYQDKLLFIFAGILLMVYVNGSFALGSLPLLLFVLAPAYYYCIRYFNNHPAAVFFGNLLILNSILRLTVYANFGSLYSLLFFFAIGVAMYFVPVSFGRHVFKLQGGLLFGILGLVLTISGTWESVFSYSTADFASVFFAISYAVFLFYLTRKQDLLSLVFICILIFRYYVDTLYDFMPKSLFFILSGLLLTGFGYWFERSRRKKGGIFHEN
ncbi:DUF2157 domain-containing protein [Geosporobacter ferrireducens]|uniref:DUF2157 domain-containing protein n=1 Tax=Geosporobacter ferrireducens TaxID=1424294 RepID=A0A1D8GJ11_9FIRM|nr:DUF2157 domain-containing protein [Geosporobacter ferrireducens]AOT70898.1 hypothetical protein Gferi_15825 [Geosporobacter ferrireducens]